MMGDSTGARVLADLGRSAAALMGPATLYMTGEDTLEVAAINTVTNQTVLVTGRFLNLDGTITPFAHEVRPGAARTLALIIRGFGDGWLLNLTAHAGVSGTLTGQTYARVRLVRGHTSGATVLGTLIAGYVTTVQSLAWPGTPLKSSLDGQGWLRSVGGTDPAAGVEITETVPTGARWRVHALSAALVTDATVANRIATLVIDDGATILYSIDPAAVQPATQNIRYSGGPGSQRLGAVNSSSIWNLPIDLLLLAGWRLRTSTNALQAGDNWGAPQLWIEEYLEGAA